MKEIDYSTYDVDSDVLSNDVISLIEEAGYDYNKNLNYKVFNVTSPFILVDNHFDLNEANNDIISIGTTKIKEVTFNGGGYYTEYIRNEESKNSLIIHGNEEEGYSIFVFES